MTVPNPYFGIFLKMIIHIINEYSYARSQFSGNKSNNTCFKMLKCPNVYCCLGRDQGRGDGRGQSRGVVRGFIYLRVETQTIVTVTVNPSGISKLRNESLLSLLAILVVINFFSH